MKYYVYISDAKVDMLLPQIPHTVKRKIATEFKVDLKILGASRKTEIDDPNDRITRLEAVCNFIREYGNVGTVDEPDEYVEGSLLTRWGPIAISTKKPEESVVVYFAGTTERTVVGLGGSMVHVIGNSAPLTPGLGSGGSMTAGLMMQLARALELRASFNEVLGPTFSRIISVSPEVVEKPIDWAVQKKSNSVFQMQNVKTATEGMEGPQQHVEFLAKRLMYEAPAKPGDKAVLLATPLYVAMAE